MKKTLLFLSASIIMMQCAHSQTGQHLYSPTDIYADRYLSNLLSPTSINRPLIPNTNNSKDLGSSVNGWRNIYFNGKLFVGGHPFFKASSPLERGGTYFGYESGLQSADTAGANTAFGYRSMFSNNSGWYNTAIGSEVLFNNVNGYGNTAVGYAALYYSNGGGNNAVGATALYLNKSGNNNEAMGFSALYNNSTGSNNVAIGHESLDNNITGNSNVAVGLDALASSKNNSDNVAIGNSALQYYNDEGNHGAVVAVGSKALVNNTTGYRNTAVGTNALQTVTKGFDNTSLGYGADVSAYNLVNATAIGSGAIVNASNKVVIGANLPGIMVIGGYAPWTNFSDGRFKENVKEDVPGLQFITKLRPVTYTVNTRKLNEHIMQKMPDSIRAKRLKDTEAFTKVSNKIQTGFIAQEVERTAKEIGYDFDGVNAPQNETDNYSIAYGEFVVPLVKAVQELSRMNDKKDSAMTALKKQNDQLETRLDEIEKLLFQTTGNNIPSLKQSFQNVELGMAAKLEQNIPNPFTNTTSIHYYLPENNGNVYINFYNTSGALLRSERLQGTGYGNINVKAKDLPVGTFQYSLIIDGRIIDTKKMVQIK